MQDLFLIRQFCEQGRGSEIGFPYLFTYNYFRTFILFQSHPFIAIIFCNACVHLPGCVICSFHYGFRFGKLIFFYRPASIFADVLFERLETSDAIGCQCTGIIFIKTLTIFHNQICYA